MVDRIKNVVMPERLQLGGLSTHGFWPDYTKKYKRSVISKHQIRFYSFFYLFPLFKLTISSIKETIQPNTYYRSSYFIAKYGLFTRVLFFLTVSNVCFHRAQCPSATATIHHFRSCRKNWDGKRNRTSCYDLQKFPDPIVANTMQKVEERALEIRRELLLSNDTF